MKHINIPIFIPHMGCPNMCVFCNQRTISGSSCFNEADFDGEVLSVLSTAGEAKPEIAFFGGSFTGIDRALMIRLLDKAESYVKSGLVSGIRMSTRPDYIDGEIVEILKKYTVSQVELGIQSMSDEVLLASRRGHRADESIRAVKLLREGGFSVVGQMMIGLPESNLEREIYTAEVICDMGCDSSRIYPTVVFRETELCTMAKEGRYIPLSVDEAVCRSAAVLSVFDKRGVDCIRIGLCENEGLHSDDSFYDGALESALGEMVMSKLFFDRICLEIEKREKADFQGKTLCVFCPLGAVSKVIGHRGENKRKILEKYGIKKFKAVEKRELLSYNIIIEFN